MIIAAIALLASAIIVPGLYLLLTTLLGAYPIRFRAPGLAYSLELWKEPGTGHHTLEIEITTVVDDLEGVKRFPNPPSEESREVLLDQFIDRMTQALSEAMPSPETVAQEGRGHGR